MCMASRALTVIAHFVLHLIEELTIRITHIDSVCENVWDQGSPAPLLHIKPRSNLLGQIAAEQRRYDSFEHLAEEMGTKRRADEIQQRIL